MAWAAQLHAVMQQHAWAAAVQTPGGVAGQFAAHQALLVALRTQQADAAGGGAAAAAAGGGSSANEVSSFGTAFDQRHKILAEIRARQQTLAHRGLCFYTDRYYMLQRASSPVPHSKFPMLSQALLPAMGLRSKGSL